MTQNLTLYAHAFASRAERVAWALNESGLPYQLKRLTPDATEEDRAEFLALNPSGKIPVLTHGDKVLTESIPMCEYVARLAPERQMLPVTDDEHYAYARLMHFMITEVEAYLWVADQAGRLRDYYPWPDGTAPFALQLAGKNVSTLKYFIGDDFACCARFTIADILLAQLTGWARSNRLAVPEKVVEHALRMQQRDGFPDAMRPKKRR